MSKAGVRSERQASPQLKRLLEDGVARHFILLPSLPESLLNSLHGNHAQVAYCSVVQERKVS